MRPLTPKLGCAVAIIAAACGDIETTGHDDITNPPPPDERPPIAERFVEEPYGIGAAWYDYDGSSHAVTPHDEIYRIRRGDLEALVEITSYYDDEGESGFVSLRARLRDSEGWREAESLSLSSNVKEAPVCVGLDPLEQRGCGESGADLVFRTDLRVVPAAGFAVSNPAMYVAGHHAGSGAAARMWRVEAEDVTTLPDALDGERLVDVRQSPSVAAIRSREHVHLQATADMRLAQWRVAGVAEGEGAREITIRSRCVDLASTADAQTPLAEAMVGESTISVSTAGAYRVALVDLCDREVVETRETPYGALWPQTDTFDLFVEEVDGEVAIRVAPGHLIWDWTAGAGDGATEFRDVDVPAGLWGDG